MARVRPILKISIGVVLFGLAWGAFVASQSFPLDDGFFIFAIACLLGIPGLHLIIRGWKGL